MTPSTPRWLLDLERLLPIRSQFAIFGNIRDSFLIPMPGGPAMVPITRALWELLVRHHYHCLLIFDPADGLRVYPNEPQYCELADRLFDLKLAAGPRVMSLESLSNLMHAVASQRAVRCALVIDFASRLARQSDHLSEAEHRFFVSAEKLSLTASPIVPQEVAGPPLFNPVLWLLNRIQDLPSWFTLDSEKVATLSVSRPDYETRSSAARALGPTFLKFDSATDAQRAEFVRSFSEGTEGMTLSALSDITALAAQNSFSLDAIEDAVRAYKTGALDNPWKKDYLRVKVRDGQPFIAKRVKGQVPAVVKSLDIIKRSVMGMTGAHVRSVGGRPRGVLFFAGPSGVGKTELAKTLTQLVFGDERAYLRFDMSEFAEEHTGARLLGAPPGYIGFDAGGELTNAVREKPFSLVLFDEIEKAHPRILDKFLQILEDGRLTDGRGDTAYFSEAVIVFTSNLGIFVEDGQAGRVQNVRPGDSYETVEGKVRQAIADYFKYRLLRPELLNRIGDNIVVFNFITPDIARQIFDGMLENIARRVFDESQLRLEIDDPIRQTLLNYCTADLSDGGRGIGNRLESGLINPLARTLFDQKLEGKSQVTVTGWVDRQGIIALTLLAQ
jgi:hypothetical protein